MVFFDKLKQLFKKSTPTNSTSPITDTIKKWLNARNWKFEHRAPTGDAPVHHLILSFHDHKNDWTCVFRINEQTQLVSAFGVLPEVVPLTHYAPVMMAVSMANLNIPFGNLEIDPHDGELRAKIAIDAEFAALSDKALDCHIQGLAGLTELAQKIFNDAQNDSEPSPILLDYMPPPADESTPEAHSEFFEPTQSFQ